MSTHPCLPRIMADHHRPSMPLPWNILPAISPTPNRTLFQQRPQRSPIYQSIMTHSRAITSTTIRTSAANKNPITWTLDIRGKSQIKNHTNNMTPAVIRKCSVHSTRARRTTPSTSRKLPTAEYLCSPNIPSTINLPLTVKFPKLVPTDIFRVP